MKESEYPKHPELYMWAALVGPGLIWLLHLSISFTIAAYDCEKANFRMHGFTIAAMLGTVAALYAGLKAYRFYTAEENIGQEGFKTKGFLSLIALMLGSLLLLTVFVSDLSNVMLEKCL